MQYLILGWLIAAVVVAMIGDTRTFGFGPAFFTSLFLSPLVGLIFVFSSQSKDQLRRDMEARKAQSAQLAAIQKAATPVDVAGQLAQLQKMKEDGALTQAEFDAAKAKLLG